MEKNKFTKFFGISIIKPLNKKEYEDIKVLHLKNRELLKSLKFMRDYIGMNEVLGKY